MVYATEETPLGTAGSVRNARDELDERFLVISGDVLTDIDLSAIVDRHVERGALATIGLTAVENPLEFGIVVTDEDGAVERFLEKPSWGQVFSDTVNNGIFVLEPQIFDHIPAGRPVDFSGEVFPGLLEAGLRIDGFVTSGYWEDVGTLEAYASAHRDVLDGKVDVDVPGFRLEEGVWLGEGAEVDPGADVVGPAVIGAYSRVEAGASVGPHSVLGSNVMVRSDADIERVVVHDNSYLGTGVRVRGSIVGRSCDLRAGVRCEEGVVLGDECFIGAQAVITNGVKVYPFKTVEAGAVVNASLVWESRGARSLFSQDGVVGLANVDVTPELATRVAMAYGTTPEEGVDGDRLARLEPCGPDAEAVGDGRPQRHGHRRRRPRGDAGPDHEVPDPLAAEPGRDLGAPGPRRPAVGRDPLLRRPRHRHHRERPAQDRAALLPGGLPPGLPR
jgi:mannose-1-phosphate guanylyltransferase/phosphomannomutase